MLSTATVDNAELAYVALKKLLVKLAYSFDWHIPPHRGLMLSYDSGCWLANRRPPRPSGPPPHLDS